MKFITDENKVYHTSTEQITTINRSGIADDCLFFACEPYSLGSGTRYVYEAEFNCIDVSELYDEEIINEIAERFDVDLETAENFLDETDNLDDYSYRKLENDGEETGFDFEDQFWLQGKQGECGKKMGYDGCIANDEQGAVYIVPMLGREKDLKLVGTIDF